MRRGRPKRSPAAAAAAILGRPPQPPGPWKHRRWRPCPSPSPAAREVVKERDFGHGNVVKALFGVQKDGDTDESSNKRHLLTTGAFMQAVSSAAGRAPGAAGRCARDPAGRLCAARCPAPLLTPAPPRPVPGLLPAGQRALEHLPGVYDGPRLEPVRAPGLEGPR